MLIIFLPEIKKKKQAFSLSFHRRDFLCPVFIDLLWPTSAKWSEEYVGGCIQSSAGVWKTYISAFPSYVIPNFFCMYPSMYGLLSLLKEKVNTFIYGRSWFVCDSVWHWGICKKGPVRSRNMYLDEVVPCIEGRPIAVKKLWVWTQVFCFHFYYLDCMAGFPLGAWPRMLQQLASRASCRRWDPEPQRQIIYKLVKLFRTIILYWNQKSGIESESEHSADTLQSDGQGLDSSPAKWREFRMKRNQFELILNFQLVSKQFSCSLPAPSFFPPLPSVSPSPSILFKGIVSSLNPELPSFGVSSKRLDNALAQGFL